MKTNNLEYQAAKKLSVLAVQWAEDQLKKIEEAERQGPDQLARAIEQLDAKEVNTYSLGSDTEVVVRLKSCPVLRCSRG